ncbi:hypothetical protein HPB52_022337 [Rhipicephalus sanguineus]|uniref:Uncharacterized protein n=1 Tax=Rhipicephalus sanguineus TaxID=34632 RepID=A0A9D4Q3H4_RHISA|nr:hypothetical protein HPB52_022337 [Rhipicephalus sanguineus]
MSSSSLSNNLQYHLSLASDGDRYDWAAQPDSWGLDHLPIIITPAGGKVPRARQCSTVEWRAFRQQLQDAPEHQDFLNLMAAAAQAATIQSCVSDNHPLPEHLHLNLRAARRRAERRYLKAQCPDHRPLFNPVDAVYRRHANRRRRQTRQDVAQKHGGVYGLSSSGQRGGNPGLQWPSDSASVIKNWQNGWPIASRHCH